MQIVRHRPITRGVTELMYVGDDEAVEKATSHRTAWALLAASGVGLLLMKFGKTKATKTIGGVIAVAPVAVELYYHSRGGCVYDDLP